MLRTAAQSHHLHHAWLVTGPEGVGKATLAFRFARALLAGFPGPCLEVPQSHETFTQVAAGTHPDLVTIERGWDDKRQRARAGMVIDDARQALEHFALTPMSDSWRVVIVDGADYLNTSAANLLLKLLEEPPDRAVFVMTSSAPNRLLRTLRSRCVQLPLHPLDAPSLSAVLRHFGLDFDADRQSALPRELGGLPGEVSKIDGIGARLVTSIGDEEDSGDHAREAAPRRPDRALLAGDRDIARAISVVEESVRSCLGRQRTDLEIVESGHWLDLNRWHGVRSDLLRLIAATDQFNLDKQQLMLEIMSAVRS